MKLSSSCTVYSSCPTLWLISSPTRRSSDLGFGAVEGGRLAGVDLTEVTPAGALRPADEERGFPVFPAFENVGRSEEHTSELQSRGQLVCRLLLETKIDIVDTLPKIPDE